MRYALPISVDVSARRAAYAACLPSLAIRGSIRPPYPALRRRAPYVYLHRGRVAAQPHRQDAHKARQYSRHDPHTRTMDASVLDIVRRQPPGRAPIRAEIRKMDGGSAMSPRGPARQCQRPAACRGAARFRPSLAWAATRRKLDGRHRRRVQDRYEAVRQYHWRCSRMHHLMSRTQVSKTQSSAAHDARADPDGRTPCSPLAPHRHAVRRTHCSERTNRDRAPLGTIPNSRSRRASPTRR